MDIPTELIQAANQGDPAARFEINRLRGLANAMGRAAVVTGLHPLSLRAFPSTNPDECQTVILPQIVRYMDLVDESLRDVFRGLVSGKERWPLFLWGRVGPGKTCAALALSDYVAPIKPWIWPEYFTMETLCNSAMVGADEWRGIIGKIKKTPLVIVDEIGEREKVADLYSTTLKQVLDARDQYANRIGIYISNINPDVLPDLLDDRLISRLLCGTIHELTGPDRRKETR